MERSAKEWVVLGAVVAIVFAVFIGLRVSAGNPVGDSLVLFVISIAIPAIFALGLSLEFGFTGLLNFGHVAFMAIGAYTTVIFTERASPSLVPAITGATAPGFLVVLLLALVAGALVALPVTLFLGYVLPPRTSPRVRTLASAVVGLVVAALVFLVSFPLDAGTALSSVVFLGVLVAVVLAAAGGVLLGLPAVRLRQDYLAIVTIGAAEILRSAIINLDWLTKGAPGIQRVDRPVVDWALSTPWFEDLADALDVKRVAFAHAIVFVVTLALVFVAFQALARSPWGRVLKAIREDEEAAASLGKNVLAYKLQSLALGSAVAALAGIALAWHLAGVYPENFLPIITFYAFIMVVVGGIGNHKGALAGAVILYGVFQLVGDLGSFLGQSFARINTAGPPQIIFIGLVLIVVMMFRPQGLLGRKEEMQFVK